MKWGPLFFIIMLSLLITPSAYSEFYKYTDEDGIVRYTDDLSTVPEDQRPEIETFESIKPPPPQERVLEKNTDEAAYSKESTPENRGTEQASQPESSEDSWKQKKSAELDAMRKELRKRYDDLSAMRKALDTPPPEDAKSGVKAEHIRKTKELNRKIREYNQLNKEFDQAVKDFNAKLSQNK